MTHYRSDRKHAEYLLFDVLGADEFYGKGPYEGLDPTVARDLLAEAERFAHKALAPSFGVADVEPPRLDPRTHEVHLPDAIRDALQAHLASDWLTLDLPLELGGGQVPPSLRWAATEFAMGANPAIGMVTQVVPQIISLLHRAGTPEQRRLAELIIERRWTTTMVLTEPEAGSDVGAARARAVQRGDGTWHVTGTKRFITWGEHDGAENIIHLVLARPSGVPGAGGNGTKGLSLFVVPSHHHDVETGTVTGRNGVVATALEHKMGITGSPTCELVFGADEPAVGTLLGDAHDGIRQMFEIITYVRMLVGLKAGAALSTGHLNAREYAMARVQGRPLVTLDRQGPDPVAIIDHPDIRRSLLTQRAYADGCRALVLYTATQLDRVEYSDAVGEISDEAAARHRMLLPVVKGWCSENAWRVLGSESLQTLGGSGFLRDHPLEQYVRDTKIDAIYEGATGIQALDLLPRRLLRDRGVAVGELLSDIVSTADRLTDEPHLAAEGRLLLSAVGDFRGMLHLAAERAETEPSVAALGATPLLLALGDLVVGWLLLRTSEAALRHLRGAKPSTLQDSADLEGRVASGQWFARQQLPRLAAELASARLLDESPLSLPPTSL